MIKKQYFGQLPTGESVHQFSLINSHGVQVEILDLGGIIRRWLVPNTSATPVDIVLGFDTLKDYLADQAYLGALVGRYANRIKHGKFSLGNNDYQVDINQGGNCLHGGADGFNRRLWQTAILNEDKNPSIALTLVSNDGDQGFPGQLNAKVVYTLTEQDTLKIEYFAVCDQDTVFNPTQHSYFNLAGHSSGSVREQEVQVLASHYTPTDEHAIPTGEIATVKNTPFDLRQLTLVKTALASSHPQIKIAEGLDHNWCLDAYQANMKQPALAAIARDPASGLSLKVSTTMPGMQVYTGNFLSADLLGKNNTAHHTNQAFCFETQFYPDAPNQSGFPSPVLKAGENFYAITEFATTF